MAGETAVKRELEQIYQRGTFTPIHHHTLTDKQKRHVLESHLFLEKKKSGYIKARLVAGGDKQRIYTPKEDVISPTCATESLMITAVIDAAEGRDVATVDIPNAFVQTKVDEVIHVRLRGRLAEELKATSPSTYTEFVYTNRRGEEVIYHTLNKALYGIMQAALLFYNKLSGDLLKRGFILNPYDPCVTNKMIEGHQTTVIWNVDDLRISHVDLKEVTEMIEWLKNRYAYTLGNDIAKMEVRRGYVHDFLGIVFDYSRPTQVNVSMKQYVEETIEEFPDKRKFTRAENPADLVLFQVRTGTMKLELKQAQLFHRFVSKLLYLAKRGRPDIGTAVAFLTTRVIEPDKDDWNKLVRCMKYLNFTKKLTLTLVSDKLPICKWWIDAAYAVHPDCRSHTWSTTTLGKGSIINISTKQKLNTRSSTEAELVGVDDVASQMLWTNYFLKSQGYNTKETIVYQDNKSAILLASNGHFSRGKRSKHISVRYFLLRTGLIIKNSKYNGVQEMTCWPIFSLNHYRE